MKELIEKFPSQLEEALAIATAAKLGLKKNAYTQVVISGLGGSGIGGTILQDFLSPISTVPIVVNKSYSIPNFIHAKTLFIACSYSGNTEETLAAFEAAKAKMATIVCVSSGGRLLELAKKNKLAYIQIPSGFPPRSCIGYSLIQLLAVVDQAGIVPFPEKEIKGIIKKLTEQSSDINREAASMAIELVNKHIAIYIGEGYEGLAIRFQQQIQENSKMLAWHNVIPEMTHNEIVGWVQRNPMIAVVHCYHKSDFPRNQRRRKYLQQVLDSYKVFQSSMEMTGKTYWETAFHFIHFTDWVSYHLAANRKRDAVEVRVIDGLKKEMGKK